MRILHSKFTPGKSSLSYYYSKMLFGLLNSQSIWNGVSIINKQSAILIRITYLIFFKYIILEAGDLVQSLTCANRFSLLFHYAGLLWYIFFSSKETVRINIPRRYLGKSLGPSLLGRVVQWLGYLAQALSPVCSLKQLS